MVGPPQNSFEGRARPFGVLCAPWRKPDESRLETVEMGKGKLRKEEVAEDVCFVCKEGGTLLICEYGDCLKVYHPQCVGKEESFLEAEEIWTCIRHKCFICDKRSRIQCICCPKACCCACVHAAGLIRVGKSKGFCSCCLELLILAKEKENIDPEGKQDLDYSEFPEFLVMGYWNQIKEQGMMSSEDLHRAEGLLKKERTEEQWASRAKNEKWLRIKRSRVKKRVFRGWGSVELIEFLTSLGKDATQPLDQWDVYNIIQEYVHKNNLSLPNRKKKVILCDKKLLPLFGKVKVKVPKIFNLLEGHFAASASSEEESFDVESEKKRMILEPSTRMIRGRFASMVGDNLKLVYLRKSLIVELLSDPQTFERKVIGCFVRIKNDLKGVDFSPDKAFLLRKVSGVEGMGVDIVLSVFHCSKTICVSMLSDDDFEEGECEDLRQLIQKGEFERPTLVEFEEKARAVHQDIMNHWIKREILLLQRKIERANEKGWGREKLELIERRALLQTGSERERLLKEIPRVMTDEDENYR